MSRIASIRKWVSIPDGGLLWGNISKPLAEDTFFSMTRLKAQCMRHEFFISGDTKQKEEFRRIFSTVSDIMDQDEPSAMSAYSYSLLQQTDWEKIRSVRNENADVLISILKKSSDISFIQEAAGKSDLYVAFRVKNRDEVQRKLSEEGIYNTIIWPLTDKQKMICNTAKYTEEHMLAAPCDQRYTVDDMRYIGNELVRIIEDVS